MADGAILVVDDDPGIRALLRRCLEAEGFAVSEAATGADVCAALDRDRPRLITLDVALDGESGLDVARAVRRRTDVPIVMVSGKDDVIDRVVGLEVGADDYLTKPFHTREVVARIRSVLRRAERAPSVSAEDADPAPRPGCYRFDGFVADTERFELTDRTGQPCDLTSGDFRLLQLFLENPKRILARETIMDRLSGIEWTPLDRTVDNQVARLRKKIERDPSRPELIKTVRGVGYVLATDVQRI